MNWAPVNTVYICFHNPGCFKSSFADECNCISTEMADMITVSRYASFAGELLVPGIVCTEAVYL